MTKCKDCKYWSTTNNIIGECLLTFDHPVKTPNETCFHGSRADGLTECCETCAYFRQDPFKRCIKDHFRFVSGEYTEDDAAIDTDKMKCDEWEAKA